MSFDVLDECSDGLVYWWIINEGHEPATGIVRSQLQTDPDGYIITIPGTTETSVKGVFAAGDVQDKRYRQAITSAGSGCMAALEVEKLIAEEEELGDSDMWIMGRFNILANE
jgi:thioredoxin reductase